MDMRVAAYAVVTDDEDRVLLAHWHQGRRPAWTMPGGGLEPGEDPADAARREVYEETGFRVELDGVIGVHSHIIAGSDRMSSDVPLQALRILYRAHVVGGELRDEQDGSTDRADWFPLADVDTLTRVSLVDIALGMAGLRARPAP